MEKAKAYSERAHELFDKKDYKRAIELFDAAIDCNPNDASTHVDRGNAYYVIGDNGHALLDYTKAIRLDPSESYAFLNRGTIWREKCEYEKALADHTACIEIGLREKKQPANLKHAYHYRGHVWSDMGRIEKAIADYNEAVRLDPEYASAYNDRGNAWSEKGEFAKALADYKRAIAIDQEYVDALCNLAWHMATCPEAKFRDGAAAVPHAATACRLTDWRDWDAIRRLAAAYAESGNFEKAIEWQKKALDLAPATEVDDLQSQLKLFSENKPYRDDSLKPDNASRERRKE